MQIVWIIKVNYVVFDDTALKSFFMENIRKILSGSTDCLLTCIQDIVVICSNVVML